jgi:phage terminase Nu1 subunit (DNA packaging protein)
VATAFVRASMAGGLPGDAWRWMTARGWAEKGVEMNEFELSARLEIFDCLITAQWYRDGARVQRNEDLRRDWLRQARSEVRLAKVARGRFP